MAEGGLSDSCSSSSYKHYSDNVTKWTKKDLDEKNIFFDDEACTIEKFAQQVKEMACLRRGFHFKCPADIPDLMKHLVSYTKEALSFTYDEQLEEDLGKEPILAAFDEALANLKAFDSYSCELMNKNKDLSHANWKLLTSWSMATETFLKCLKLFLSTRLRNEQESECEGQFAELMVNFTRIFFMTPESGDARKRELDINKVRVSSTPDIHFIKDTSSSEGLGTLSVLCAEVHKAVIDASTLVTVSFKANEMIGSKILGQHGGSLLLEKISSAFEPKVLGMICHRTKIMFTYMDLKSSHYKIIVQKGVVKDDKHRCTIYYTKPYDFLIKSDRDEILEFLFWIGFIQSMGESENI